MSDPVQASLQSVNFQVLRAIVARLGGKAQNAHRCRLRDFSKDEAAGGADNVLPEDETSTELVTDDSEYSARFMVRHLVTTAEGADRLADARFVRGAQLLLQEPTLGGLVRRVKLIGRKWEMERAELEQMAIVATYEVTYSTRRDNPAIPGY